MERSLVVRFALWRTQRAYRRRYRQSLSQWLAYHQRHVVFAATWMGVKCRKSPMEAWIYQQLIHAVRPDVIVEIGSDEGGSTLMLAHFCDALNHGTVISVEADRARYHVTHPRIIDVTGDSGSPETVAQVAALCQGKSVMVIHDGDHRTAAVLRDLEAYGPLVTVGSYLIVEDGIVDVLPLGGDYVPMGNGPLPAIHCFLRHHPEFVVDAACERYALTYNPQGYLRRVR